MLQEVLLPQLGQTMEEGTVEKWHKSEGEEVQKGEVLFELTTDKATLEVEAYASGVVKKILVEEGETVPVNELVAIIGEPDDELPEDIDEFRKEVTEEAEVEVAEAEEPERRPAEEGAAEATPAAEEAEPATKQPAQPAKPEGRIFSSPRARKIAEEQKVPISVLSGSGPNGRIIERDVQSYVEELEEKRFTPTAREVAFQSGVDLLRVKPSEPGERITKADVEEAAAQIPAPAAMPGERVELSAMRQTIAQRMTESKQTVPHFYLVGEIKMREALAFRQELNSNGNVHITITDLLVRAAGLALRKHPRMNARYEGESIVVNEQANVGVAVAVEDGLFVPVIKDAASRDLGDISQDLKSLAKTAREGKLRPDQYEGGCLTISNLGTYGIDYFMPIINPPESCIIGIGKVGEEIVVQDGAMRIEPMMKVSLSADHRVVDGASAAEFFATFRDLLEDPQEL
jgi:pyruvate dehydrogenase E2 component (dihydrolipoamide acetyltransferase)